MHPVAMPGVYTAEFSFYGSIVEQSVICSADNHLSLDVQAEVKDIFLERCHHLAPPAAEFYDFGAVYS